MDFIQNVLATALLAIWCGVSIGFLVGIIQNIKNEHRREKREEAKLLRDAIAREKQSRN